ncbi:MAG: SAM-dependent chlorinase/fluorinase [Candidatus Hydrothermarchaeales archaeon]
MITLITDFGESAYVGAMKGVIVSICPKAKIVDLTHSIKKFDVRNAAYELHAVAKYFPKGTIHCVVVDPGVGTERRGLIIQANDCTFVGPDNGVFTFVEDIKNVYEISAQAEFPTFHGRDVFAPISAKLACGASPEELGKEIKDIERIKLSEVKIEDGSAAGEVITTDYFGNVITNIRKENLRKAGINYDDSVVLRVKGLPQKTKLVESYGFAKKGELICLIGSAGYLEIAINQGDASSTLDVHGGEEVVIQK